MLLHHGAAKVFAVDVGHGQLAWKLRNDPRVVVMERVNARYLDSAARSARRCWSAMPASSASAPCCRRRSRWCAPGGWAVALIKPQFEVGPAIAKGGVVRDANVHRQVCHRISDWWAGLPGWRVLGVEASPLLGPEGNREFLIAARKAA